MTSSDPCSKGDDDVIMLNPFWLLFCVSNFGCHFGSERRAVSIDHLSQNRESQIRIRSVRKEKRRAMQREAKEKSAKGKRHRSYKGEENHNKIGRGNFTEKTYPKRKFFLDFATLLISFSFFFFFFLLPLFSLVTWSSSGLRIRRKWKSQRDRKSIWRFWSMRCSPTRNRIGNFSQIRKFSERTRREERKAVPSH